MKNKYDFCGWATRYNIKCSDGRTIAKDAFAHCDGKTVPVVWNHGHGEVRNVLGHALLEKRDDGIYAYGSFNDTEYGKHAKGMVMNGDITALSIYANKLVEKSAGDVKVVSHGEIRELSLVLAGANLGAYIEQVNISHSDEEAPLEEANIYVSEEDTELTHSDETSEEEPETKEEGTEEVVHADNESNEDDETIQDVIDSMNEKQKTVLYGLVGKAIESNGGEAKEETNEYSKVEHSDETDDEETVQDIIDSMNEKQKTVLYALVGKAVEENNKDEQSQGGNETMKHNVFENEKTTDNNVLCHADQEKIIALAKTNSVGSLQEAIKIYAADNNKTLAHGFEDIEALFPDYKDLKPGAPEMVKRDLGWVDHVMKKVHKSPISRIRTRQVNVKDADLRALGYKKENEKQWMGVVALKSRTTDPQTIYVKDKLNRDDIIDITDFSVVDYQYTIMKDTLYEEIATAIMIGDGRVEGADDKISETHVRSIWNDDELYTIHCDVNFEEAAAELQGSNTAANFGENYIWAEAMVTASLYGRETYKGSGNLELYITPHMLNVMLLAKDLNGRRIYSSKAELAAALNVSAIHTAEQFEGKVRTTADGKKKKLIGLFVNLSDYQAGSTKGGEITKFEDFDIDFNQHKYLIETRMSGALTRIKSAIALEEDVTDAE